MNTYNSNYQTPLLIHGQSSCQVQYSAVRYMPAMPINRLPIQLQKVIGQVHNLTQAPEDLIAACCLGVMSLACQDLFDVSSKPNLRGPISLYLMILAESGERKSTIDGYLMPPIRKYEWELNKQYQEEQGKYDIEEQLWLIESKRLEKQYAHAVTSGEGIEGCRKAIIDCKRREPSQPVRRRLIINDITKAAVKQELGMGCASLFLYSDEAGSILKGELLHDAPLMNSLWSGKPIEVDRAGRKKFIIEDARLGYMLQIQPKLYTEYVNQHGVSARASGFFARTLVCQPPSAIGSRLESYSKPHLDDDELSWFHFRVNDLLIRSFERRAYKHDRICLSFSPEAFALWQREYNGIESKCGPCGCLNEFRDYASKHLEHVSRIAGVLEAFITGGTIISESTMHTAICIAQYFLDSFIYLNSDNAPSEEVEDSLLLDAWLRENQHRFSCQIFPKNYIRKFGPNRLRDKVRLERALLVLQQRGVVNSIRKGRSQYVRYFMRVTSFGG